MTSIFDTYTYLAIGTGTTPASTADTALGTEIARVSAVVSSLTSPFYQVTGTFTAGVGRISEYGLFNSATAGSMLTRELGTVLIKGASDTLNVTLRLSDSLWGSITWGTSLWGGDGLSVTNEGLTNGVWSTVFPGNFTNAIDEITSSYTSPATLSASYLTSVSPSTTWS